MLLPGAVPTDAAADSAVLQRLERIERRVTASGTAEPARAAAPAEPARPAARPAAEAPAYQRPTQPAPEQPATKPATQPAAQPAAEPPAAADDWPEATPPGGKPAAPAPAEAPAAEVAPEPAGQGTIDAVGIRRSWSAVLEKVREVSRSTEAMLTNASVQSVEGDTVTIGHTAAALARRLAEPRNVEAIATALEGVFGGTWHVRCVHAEQGGPGAATAPKQAKAELPTFQRPTQAAQPPREPAPPRPAPAAQPAPAPQRADELPPPPEPPDEEDYDASAGPVPDVPPPNPEADMVKLLTDKLGARQLDR
jgi:DNA polymerase-3 subunit gamma/tau